MNGSIRFEALVPLCQKRFTGRRLKQRRIEDFRCARIKSYQYIFGCTKGRTARLNVFFCILVRCKERLQFSGRNACYPLEQVYCERLFAHSAGQLEAMIFKGFAENDCEVVCVFFYFCEEMAALAFEVEVD